MVEHGGFEVVVGGAVAALGAAIAEADLSTEEVE